MYLSDVKRGQSHRMGFGTPTNLWASKDLPDDTTAIRRFVSIEAFNEMHEGALGFTRADLFLDPFDGTFPESEKRGARAGWEETRQNTAISCWTMNEALDEQAYAELDANGGPKREICVHSTIQRLCDALKWRDHINMQSERSYLRSPVLYCDRATFDATQGNGLRAFFWKDEPWSHENEYRFLYRPYRHYAGGKLDESTKLEFNWWSAISAISVRPSSKERLGELIQDWAVKHRRRIIEPHDRPDQEGWRSIIDAD